MVHHVDPQITWEVLAEWAGDEMGHKGSESGNDWECAYFGETWWGWEAGGDGHGTVLETPNIGGPVTVYTVWTRGRTYNCFSIRR